MIQFCLSVAFGGVAGCFSAESESVDFMDNVVAFFSSWFKSPVGPVLNSSDCSGVCIGLVDETSVADPGLAEFVSSLILDF